MTQTQADTTATARTVVKLPADTAAKARTVAKLPADTTAIATDTVKADTVKAGEELKAVVMTKPAPQTLPVIQSTNLGSSWVFGLLLLLFSLVCFRFRNNSKYIRAIVSDLFEVRERGNNFDDTVRESSFLIILNILWSCCAGVILWGAMCALSPVLPAGLPSDIPQWSAIKICIGVGICYTILMACAYGFVGTVFGDRPHAAMWVKGFAASQGLQSPAFLILALLTLCYPTWLNTILWVALATFLFSRIVFIWKGFRIFFTQISSWVLFLYYLCSLEIVPIIIAYVAALQLCTILLK